MHDAPIGTSPRRLTTTRRPAGGHDLGCLAVNLAGSVFFMLAAIAALTLPSTDDLLDASLVNSGTLLGAACFFWGARLMLVVSDPER